MVAVHLIMLELELEVLEVLLEELMVVMEMNPTPLVVAEEVMDLEALMLDLRVV